MRIGSNPEKVSGSIDLNNYHRIIVPVYIPNFEGYFKDSFETFKLCIASLLLTVHSKTRITIYNNNCHVDVKNYIDEQFNNSLLIDQVFHSKENLGKINAFLAASKGNLEPLITVTDADVLFKIGWQKNVEQLFLSFPNAGMVSPVPISKFYKSYTANNWVYGLLKGKIFFDKVINPDALKKFDHSLGNVKSFFDPIHLEKYLVLKNKENNAEAVMGCGHFVATLRREVFDLGTSEPSYFKIDHAIENKFIDIPNENLGFLRIATKENYAYHLGNAPEKWMYEELELLKNNKEDVFLTHLPQAQQLSNVSTKIGKLIISLLNRKIIRVSVLNYLGLNSKENY
jgi:hypothetical protein